MLKRLALCVFGLMFSGKGFAATLLCPLVLNQEQYTDTTHTDSTKILALITISGIRYPAFFTGNKFEIITSKIIAQNNQNTLAQLLSDHSQLFIKSYGPSTLASPSFRGGNAYHTPVLWNGFNLQSSMNGQVDFSLIPGFLMEGLVVQYGSQAALFGSGAMGGTIHLQTQAPFQKGLKGEVMIGAASYQTYSGGIKLYYRTEKWQMSQKLFIQNSLNNFKYKNIDLLQKSTGNNIINADLAQTQRAINGSYETRAWIQELDFTPKQNHSIMLRSWVQNNLRNLPPALNIPDTSARQIDKTRKISAEYKYKKQAYEINIRHGFFDDYLSYYDKNSGLSISKSQSNISYIDQFYRLAKYSFQLSVMNQYNSASNASYIGWVQQNRIALFGSFKWLWLNQKLQQQMSIRQEWVLGKAIPIMPAYGIIYQINSKLSVSGNVSRSYRLPTFNDLYWAVWGNPSLLPESGWNEEISLLGKTTLAGKFRLQANITVFNKNVSNWIIWVPDAGGNVSPQNISKVWSRGLETEWKINWNIHQWEFNASGIHNLTLASNEATKSMNDSSLNKQLIYTPRIKHLFELGVAYKGITLSYYHNYTGIRFVSTDNQSWLLPYQNVKICLAKSFRLKTKSIGIQLLVNNLYNETYQVMQNRPMPLRNYQISINYKF